MYQSEIRTIIAQLKADIRAAFCRDEKVALQSELEFFQHELKFAEPDEDNSVLAL